MASGVRVIQDGWLRKERTLLTSTTGTGWRRMPLLGPKTVWPSSSLANRLRKEGEATANNRKAKLIFLFEWLLEIKFLATVAGSDVEYKGMVEVPNLSDENQADEVDAISTIETKGPHEAEIRHLLSKDGVQFIREQAGIYIQELKEQFSKGLILPTDKTLPQVIAKGKTVDKKSFQNQVITSNASNSTPTSTTTTSNSGDFAVKKLEISETFKVPPERLFEILTDPELVRAWSSGGSADPKEGGQFSLLGGQISGVFTKLLPNKEITTNWRLKKYPANYFAELKFVLRDQNDSTDLVVQSDGIPEEHFEDTFTGIHRYYFQNIARTLVVDSKSVSLLTTCHNSSPCVRALPPIVVTPTLADVEYDPQWIGVRRGMQEPLHSIIHIKWNHQGTLRRFQLSEVEWKFSKLLEKIRLVEPMFSDSLCYADEDGDKIIFHQALKWTRC
uniref:Activator of Hsp90 ATPase AHSA1-like N-terminal domain-containing protein n=1 Tax=Ditylenchus dipsaci TaxID=166011 RepID=A0A915CM30_9BILA